MCGIIGILLAENDPSDTICCATTDATDAANNENVRSSSSSSSSSVSAFANQNHVNQMLFDGLTVLQHRGQDAAGIVTASYSYTTTTTTMTATMPSLSLPSSPPSNTASSKRLTKKWRLHLRKDNGLVKDVFQQHHMVELQGHVGLGHTRYPTAGRSNCSAEAQPLYTNYPYGICVVHNGNITNTEQLSSYLYNQYNRHINTDSDSELLLNVFAEQLTQQIRTTTTKTANTAIDEEAAATTNPTNIQNAIFAAMEQVMQQCKGGYAGLYLINGYGLVGFRDPYGIRPLVFGCRRAECLDSNNNGTSNTANHPAATASDADGIPMTPKHMNHVVPQNKLDYCICSESVALDTLGFKLIRDIRAGEAIYIDMEGNCHSRMVHPQPNLSPCIFEYVYFARPDSIMDGVSVYETRLRMGEKLAAKILRTYPNHEIDVVIPIPDTSRTAALQASYTLNRPFREGFIKNRYIPRTFIMPGQAKRRKSIRLKLNTIKSEFNGKNVLLVDDSIVRGTTAHEIVQMARDAGARKVFFSSAAPPIRYPNIYGIDIPTRTELMAYQRNEEQIAEKIGCDWVVYQDLKDLEDSVLELLSESSSTLTIPTSKNKGDEDPHQLKQFDTSCFSGIYVTGETINDPYFTKLHQQRNDTAQEQSRQHGSTAPTKHTYSINNGGSVLPSSNKHNTTSDGFSSITDTDDKRNRTDVLPHKDNGAPYPFREGSRTTSCESMANLESNQHNNSSSSSSSQPASNGGDTSACEPI